MRRRDDTARVAVATTPSKPRGAASPWTPEEDARLRELVTRPLPGRARRLAPLVWPEVLAAFPGRTRDALQRRISVVRAAAGLRAKRTWTRDEDRTLRESWTEVARRTILARLPGRSWCAISQRAVHVLGLPTIPQGWEILGTAAKRRDAAKSHVRNVIAWSRAWAPLVEALCDWAHEVSRLYGHASERPATGWETGAVVTTKHTTTFTAGASLTLVEEGALDDALDRWDAWWSSGTAASQWNVWRHLLAEWARRDGWRSPHRSPFLRLPPSWWEAIAADHGLVRGGQALKAHAQRHGISEHGMRNLLRRQGVALGARGRKKWLLASVVDAAVARDRAGRVRRPA